jgi:hypothetical protein
MPDAALAAAATLVATAFAFLTGERWLARRRRHDRAWTISLALFALASAALWLGATRGWTEASFKAFYLFGAVLNVPWLALGTLELLAGERAGRRATLALTILSGFAAGVVVEAPLRAPVPRAGLPEGRHLFGALPRVLAAVCSGGAATVVIAGALWSAWQLWRGRPRRLIDGNTSRATASTAAAPAPARRLVLANALIALGTLVLGASGSLSGRIGALRAFAVTLLVGIVILFGGFLLASLGGRRARPLAWLVAAPAGST